MNKKICVILNFLLLTWFSLDMIGMEINGQILVTRSYREDGVFFFIFLAMFLWFIFKEKIGKYLLTGWLFMWLITQFIFHWYYTVFGPSEDKMNYFADTIKLIHSNNIYIPDLYHIILHLLILIALINMIIYLNKSKKKKGKNLFS